MNPNLFELALTVLPGPAALRKESWIGSKKSYFKAMPMTRDQIVEETRHWPPEKVGELVGRLTGDLHTTDVETETAWQNEIARRIEEIKSGKVAVMHGERRPNYWRERIRKSGS